ncbi:unnamed protein product [Rotaria sordida]|uniref:Hedgehog protein Hint domain-containing protein n=1 Tax=Rotaria sordida TaxID=392033 RepID=A0A815CFU9_9BILA|nr:unnamed protein product [Rotaria sordida]CAF1282311.1 unnamed protein product [Rotaria sordida]CAF3687175.1 unnamed protein product [Rotaria sordida]CAF3732216.1 unnamed protein product [Rotaria sordida]
MCRYNSNSIEQSYGAQFWAGCAEDMLNSGSGCLAGDGLVQLASGSYKTVSELRAGDRVLAVDEHKPELIVETDVMMIMHRVSDEYGMN